MCSTVLKRPIGWSLAPSHAIEADASALPRLSLPGLLRVRPTTCSSGGASLLFWKAQQEEAGPNPRCGMSITVSNTTSLPDKRQECVSRELISSCNLGLL